MAKMKRGGFTITVPDSRVDEMKHAGYTLADSKPAEKSVSKPAKKPAKK